MTNDAANLNTYSYDAIENIQRNARDGSIVFYLFHAPAIEISKWGLIDRMSEDNHKGIQRLLNRNKVKGIVSYLKNKEYTNTIATSIIVVLNKDSVSFANKTITIKMPDANQPGVIVDGQHRVIGAKEYAEMDNESINLNVVGILGADDAEGAFQFLTINNNSSKVSPSQVKALFTSYKEDQLVRRMMESGSKNINSDKISALDYCDGIEDSPFHKQIKWAKNAGGFIVPNGIESGLTEVATLSANLSIEGDELSFFLSLWAAIKEHWNSLWNQDSQLLKKVTIQCLTSYIVDQLISIRLYTSDDIDFKDPDCVKAYTIKILDSLSTDFFSATWTLKSLDTLAGQAILKEDIGRIASNIKNKRPWPTGLQTIKQLN